MRELQQRMDSEEFTYWRAHHKRHRWDANVEMLALIATLYHNINYKPKKKFTDIFPGKEPVKRMAASAIEAMFRMAWKPR